jgi:hypothetical protein
MPGDNKAMLSVALAALAAGKKVNIIVDDSLPRVNGWMCQVAAITILSD